MKTIIAKAMLAVICAMAFSAPVQADNDKPIEVSQLPTAAQQVITANFSDKKVALAKVETGLLEKRYDVIFTTGEKIEFDRKGNWTEIDCKLSAVPESLVPEKIKAYVSSNYAGNGILKIERDSREYEVKLSNGIEITFNTNFVVIDID